MSRIGKKGILIPDKVKIERDGDTMKIIGPLGSLSRAFLDDVKIAVADGEIKLSVARNTKKSGALWGTYASHIANMVRGVTGGFEKKLVIEGVGYRAQVEGEKLKLAIGYSHPVLVDIPDGVKVSVEKNVITVSGIDKEKVGQFSASVRALKKPEPYKGKGIRYSDEVIRRKEGKKATASA